MAQVLQDSKPVMMRYPLPSPPGLALRLPCFSALQLLEILFRVLGPWHMGTHRTRACHSG